MLVVVCVAMALACAHPIPVDEPEPGRERAGETRGRELLPVVLSVENDHSGDVVISIEHGGVISQLGTVPVGSERTFRIPPAWTVATPAIELLARSVGGNPTAAYRSGFVTIRTGQSIELTIERGLQRSRYAVF